MALIVPFRGIRYNSDKVGDLAGVITPPYDVITAEDQEQLYRRNPHNFIRLEYGKTGPGKGSGEDRYTRAAAFLQKWLDQKALLREEKPSFYLYRQTFTHQGALYHRSGLIAALKLEPYSRKVILPHEDTLASPKADRLALLRLCRANFSPIFGLFSDPARRFAEICAPLEQKAPLYHFSDHSGEEHQLWQVAGAAAQEALTRLIAPQKVFIADGHHRYDTALRHAQEFGPESGPGSGYVLAVLVPLEDPGLLILPFHRLLRGLDGEQLALLKEKVRERFKTKRYSAPDQLLSGLAAAASPALGLLLPEGCFLLTTEEKQGPEELDVSLLKRLLLDPIFDDTAAERYLDFTISGVEAAEAVARGKAQAAFLLKPTPVEAVTARAVKGENMPQKSTCFYPKLPSGLVVHHLDLSH